MPDENEIREIDLEESIDFLQKSKLVKIVMEKECFLEARLDLEQMNINGATLFRGLDGLGKRFNEILNSVEDHQKGLISQTND